MKKVLLVKSSPLAVARYNPPYAVESCDAALIAKTKVKHPKPWRFVWQGCTFFDDRRRPRYGRYIIIDANGGRVPFSYPVMLRMITAINTTNN